MSGSVGVSGEQSPETTRPSICPASLIDEMFSTAIASVLEVEEWAMTAEFKINFLRALNPQPLNGDARVLRRTRLLAFLEAQIIDQNGVVAVTATSTWAIMRP